MQPLSLASHWMQLGRGGHSLEENNCLSAWSSTILGGLEKKMHMYAGRKDMNMVKHTVTNWTTTTLTYIPLPPSLATIQSD